MIKKFNIRVISGLAIFNFIFLGIEYLFDNMMAKLTDSSQVVIAQSYVLGISIIGFLIFSVIYRFMNRRVVWFCAITIVIICLFIILQQLSYIVTLISGCIIFMLLGITGSAVHYMAASELQGDENIAKTIGIGYALGLLLQFINNNVVNNDLAEMVIISIFLFFLAEIITKNSSIGIEVKNTGNEGRIYKKTTMISGIMLVFIVILMTCIFSTLDNAVTFFHSEGYMDIGKWPRLFLALSGLTAGVLFDIKNRHYMNIIMYCVTLLSTICVLVIVSGGSFLTGLIVFYLSAGFFVVFFSTSFIIISYDMRTPRLWAGLGRAVNNMCAGITGAFSLKLIQSADAAVISMAAIFLFALLSIAIFIYTGQFEKNTKTEPELQTQNVDAASVEINESLEHFKSFSETFSLTPREEEVLNALLTSDDNMQDIANGLFISRAALYRHIASVNKKTNTKSRIGLLQYYYEWKK